MANTVITTEQQGKPPPQAMTNVLGPFDFRRCPACRKQHRRPAKQPHTHQGAQHTHPHNTLPPLCRHFPTSGHVYANRKSAAVTRRASTAHRGEQRSPEPQSRSHTALTPSWDPPNTALLPYNAVSSVQNNRHIAGAQVEVAAHLREEVQDLDERVHGRHRSRAGR